MSCLFTLQQLFFFAFTCVCIQFTDGPVENGLARWWTSLVVHNYREELLLALAVSAATVERPKQLGSTLPLPLHSTHPPSTSKGVCGMGSAALAGWLEMLYLGPAIILHQHPAVSLERHHRCSFISVSSSAIQLRCSLTHTSTSLVAPQAQNINLAPSLKRIYPLCNPVAAYGVHVGATLTEFNYLC